MDVYWLQCIESNDQKTHLISAGIHNENLYRLHEEQQSHIHDRPTIHHNNDIIRFCGYRWKKLSSNELTETWQDRATEVNTLLVIGKVESQDVFCLDYAAITQSINAESEKMRSYFHNAHKSYKKERRQKTVCKMITYHKDRFQEGTQVFRHFIWIFY